MQISLHRQYQIRKLLRQYASQFNYPISGIGLKNHLEADINQILIQLYPNSVELDLRLQELETLIELHHFNTAFHQGETVGSENASQTEQRILWLLGLKFLVLLPTLPLTIATEIPASLFYFVLDQGIHQGISRSREIYGNIFEFGADYSALAYSLILTLSEQQIPFIFTVSEARHGIWVSLKSPLYRDLAKQARSLPKTLPHKDSSCTELPRRELPSNLLC
jgi:hypothetical protein